MTEPRTPVVTLETEGPIAKILFNSPPRNSYDLAFMIDFERAIDLVCGNDDIRVVVVTSAIPGVFCAGADLKAFMAQSAEGRITTARFANDVLNELEAMTQVVIAGINGHCLGGGLEIAMACDIRFLFRGGGKPTLLGLPETNLGLMPGTGGTQRLPRLIGQGRAMHYILTGEYISPDNALLMGLVNGVSDTPEDLERQVSDYAAALANRAPRALEGAKTAIIRGAGKPLHDGLRIEVQELAVVFGTADAEEGMTAFVEKRDPVWTGK